MDYQAFKRIYRIVNSIWGTIKIFPAMMLLDLTGLTLFGSNGNTLETRFLVNVFPHRQSVFGSLWGKSVLKSPKENCLDHYPDLLSDFKLPGVQKVLLVQLHIVIEMTPEYPGAWQFLSFNGILLSGFFKGVYLLTNFVQKKPPKCPLKKKQSKCKNLVSSAFLTFAEKNFFGGVFNGHFRLKK